MNKNIAVVGAGIAGLTAAWYLQKFGYSVTVYEESNRVGGRMTTDRVDDCLIDRGAQFLSSDYSTLIPLIHELGINIDAFNKNHFAGFGGFGSIFAGYGRSFKRFYLAGEINANLSSVEYELIDAERLSGSFDKTTFTVKNSEGFGLLPGFFLSENTLCYGRLGVANGRIDINVPPGFIQNLHARRNGFRYGLGIRHRISSHWIAMMDYNQINYQSVDTSFSLADFGIVFDIKFIPNTAQAAFGLLYQFDVPVEKAEGLSP